MTGRKAFYLGAAVAALFGVVSLGVLSGMVTPGDTAPSRDLVELGDFESGLDGWQTGGGTNLSRVTDDEVPAGIDSGRYALAVEVEGGSGACPAVWNHELAKNADFLHNPYIGIHVVAYSKQTDSDLKFRLRIHHGSSDGALGSGEEGVLETEPKSVPQIRSRTVQWNLSGAPEYALRSAERLDIVWFLNETDSNDDDCPHGGFEDDALVVLDNVRLNESPIISEARSWQRKKLDLHREHGMIVDREFHEMTKDYERGTWIFSDGTEIQYEYRSTPDGYTYVIDGEVFRVRRDDGT